MGTTKRRQTKRNNSRQTALTFLTNITLGNEHEIQKLSTLNTTTIESPTTAQYDNDYISPTAIMNKGGPSITKYGTLSVSKNAATKGIRLDSSDSNSISDDQVPIQLTVDTSLQSNAYSSSENLLQTVSESRRLRRISTSNSSGTSKHRRFSSSSSSNSSEVVRQYKLKREDSERPIASEKIKKRSDHQDKNFETGSTGFMSVFRYYKGFIRQPRRRSENPYHHNGHNHHIYYHSYFHQYSANLHLKHRKALSYSHFLSTRKSQTDQTVPNCSSSSDEASTSVSLCISPLECTSPILNYDPDYFDDENYLAITNNAQNSNSDARSMVKSNTKKKEFNEIFRKKHPELSPEITLSKINAIKIHLLNIGKAMDLEISSISHAFVYFEKLVQKQIVNKQNRKLVAACCLFLATKVNEPKGSWFEPLLEAIHSELSISPKDVRNHEFAVFADLEFNVYVPIQEFMPHFDRIFKTFDYKSIEDYIGNDLFYKAMDNGFEIIGCASSTSSC